jgi:hypothetical protein
MLFAAALMLCNAMIRRRWKPIRGLVRPKRQFAPPDSNEIEACRSLKNSDDRHGFQRFGHVFFALHYQAEGYSTMLR